MSGTAECWWDTTGDADVRIIVAVVTLSCTAPAAPVELSGDDALACAECHESHYQEWSQSRHASAFVGELFRHEWSAEREAFCLGCHAPNVDDPELPVHEDAVRGVDCAACHVSDGVIHAAQVSGDAPHPSRVDPTFSTADFCSRCHQVDFPEQPGLPLQDTVHEWRQAGGPAGSCQTCHMESSGGRHRHDFLGGHDVDWVSQAMQIETELVRDETGVRLVMTLLNEGAGHAIPTGDVFRRLAIRAWPEGAEFRAREKELGRHFDTRGSQWEPLTDDRVFPGEARQVEFEFPRVDAVAWRVELRSLPRALALPDVSARHAPRRLREGVVRLGQRTRAARP